MEKISQETLNEHISKHRMFLQGQIGGIRAVLKFKDLSGLDFGGADLSNADFTGSSLKEANLSNGVFESTSFFSCSLQKASLEGANFFRCDFRGTNIMGANLKKAKFNNADFRKGIMINYDSDDGNDGWAADGDTKFAGTQMDETDMSYVMAQGSDFSDANLSGVIIHEANLQDANFERANLSHSDFRGSNMMNTNLTDAHVKGIKVRGVSGDISAIDDLREEDSGRKSLAKDNIDIKTLVKNHTQWIATAGKEGGQLNLTGYNLSEEITLKDFQLTMIVAKECKFTGLDLTGAKMQSSVLDESEFQDCVARKADFRGSSFKNSLFTRADFTGADFSALKVGKGTQKEVLHPVNLSGAKMAFAKLDNVDFRGADLTDVDFRFATLKNADFKGATLDGTIFDDADIKNANFEGTIRA